MLPSTRGQLPSVRFLSVQDARVVLFRHGEPAQEMDVPIHQELQVVERIQHLIVALQELLKTIKVVPHECAQETEKKKSTAIRVWILLVPVPQVTPIPQHPEEIVEQGVSVPQVTDEIVESVRLIPQERIHLRSVAEVGDASVPQFQEQTVEGFKVLPQLLPQQRMPKRIARKGASATDQGENSCSQ